MKDAAEEHRTRLARAIDNGERLQWARDQVTREEFDRDWKVNGAIRNRLKDYTEEMERLGKPLRHADPEMEWSRLAALHQRAHHVYYDLPNEEVWRYLVRDLDRDLRRLRKVRLG